MTRLLTLGARLLLATLLAMAALALAEGTDADTSITNVASATYNDSAGNPQTTFSNPVTTIVQQVYSLTITPNGSEAVPGQTESALPGAGVSFNYIVTNTGNGDDTIDLTPSQVLTGPADDFDLTGVTLYHDVGCDGSVAGDPVITSVDLGADAFACIIMVGTIPGSAGDGDVGKIDLGGASSGDPAQTDDDNWALAEANTAGNLTGNKTASPSGGVAAGGTLSYTITGSNNGGGAAYGVALTYVPSGGVGTTLASGIFVSDDIPANTSYDANSLAGSAGAGTVRTLFSDDGGTTWYDDAADVPGTIDAVGILIEGSGAFFPQAAGYQMSFDVTVDAAASAGSIVVNQATIAYSRDGIGSESTTTNPTSNTVNATYGAALGPDGNATTDGLSGSASYTDPVSGDTWTVDLTGGYSAGNDTQTITDTVYTGDTIAFRHTLENLGNAADSFTITALSAQGYTVTLFRADGVTPITGPIGPLAPGASQDIVVKVAIPVGATLADTVTVTATSVNDPSESDASTDAIPAPLNGFAVDVAQLGESNDGNELDDTLGSDVPADPGETLSFPIEVSNTGQQDDSYDLTAILPAGWTVVFVEDADCNGVADGAAVTSTPLLDPGDTVCYLAQITVPAGAGPSADNPISVTATSNGDGTVSNTVTGTVDVNTVADLTFISDQTATTSPDSVVTYSHTVSNNGNDSTTVEIPAQGATTFTYQYAIDSDGDGDFSDETFYSELTAGNGQDFVVAAGGSQRVFVRVIVPDTASDGDEETVTVTATGTYPDASSASDGVQDRTVVQAGELDVTKTARTCADAGCASVLDAGGATADPDDYIEYRVVASNIGTGNLSAVRISDPLPGFTDFVSTSATTTVTGGTVLYSTDGSSWSGTAPGTLAAGASVYVGVDTDSDGDITSADLLGPAESITLTLVVRVQ